MILNNITTLALKNIDIATKYERDVPGVISIVVGSELSSPSSNPKQSCLYFT